MILVNGQKIELGSFPDNTLLLKALCQGKDIKIKWHYESDSEIFALYCLAKHLKEINPFSEISLYMPYIPHARMDRIQEIDDTFTLKYFSEIINSLHFSKVEAIDVHSWVSEKAFTGLINKTPLYLIGQAVDEILKKENFVNYYYPDKGAYKRYGNLLNSYGVYGEKVRDWASGKIIGLNVIGEVEKDAPILMIDDIISFGGTLHYSALKLKELGCGNIYIYATHVENSILDEEKGLLIKNGLIEKIYTTNSIFTGEHPLIEVMKI